MPSEKPNRPLRGDEFRQFLKQSAETVKTWPDWMRGDNRPAPATRKTNERSVEKDNVPARNRR